MGDHYPAAERARDDHQQQSEAADRSRRALGEVAVAFEQFDHPVGHDDAEAVRRGIDRGEPQQLAVGRDPAAGAYGRVPAPEPACRSQGARQGDAGEPKCRPVGRAPADRVLQLRHHGESNASGCERDAAEHALRQR